jgi:hypothetical protein
MNTPAHQGDDDQTGTEIDGLSEFGETGNWISLDASRGKLVCKTLNAEYDGFYCIILEAKLIRVMKDREGVVLCESNDRLTADAVRPGRECLTCCDRDHGCFPRWRLTWQDEETGTIFHHTLSTTASFNFQRYATDLCHRGLHPSQVLTSISVEQATRQQTGTSYRRLQFERVRVLSDER